MLNKVVRAALENLELDLNSRDEAALSVFRTLTGNANVTFRDALSMVGTILDEAKIDERPEIMISRGSNSWVATFRGGEEARILDLFATATLPLPYSLEYDDVESIVKAIQTKHPEAHVHARGAMTLDEINEEIEHAFHVDVTGPSARTDLIRHVQMTARDIARRVRSFGLDGSKL